MISSIVGQIITVLFWFMVFAVVGLVCFILYKESQFKHIAVVKSVNNGNVLTIIDKAKEVKEKDGTIWWVLKKNKSKVPEPPKNCVELTNKGKFVVQFYQIDGGELLPSKDGFEIQDGKEFLKRTQSFTPSQRQLTVNEIGKAERNRKKSIGEMIATFAPYFAVLMILVLFMIFFDTAVQPMKEVGDKYEHVAENLKIASEKLDGVIHDRITINEYEEVSGNYNSTTPPN